MRFFLSLLFLAFFFQGLSQIQKGTLTIGADLAPGFRGSYQRGGQYNMLTMRFNSSIGWFAKDNVMRTLVVGFYSQVYKSNITYVNSTFFIGQQLRNYYRIASPNRHFGWFLNREFMLAIPSYAFSNQLLFRSSYTLSVNPGFFLFIGQRTALEISVAELFVSTVPAHRFISYGLNDGQPVELGIKYFLNYSSPKENPRKRRD